MRMARWRIAGEVSKGVELADHGIVRILPGESSGRRWAKRRSVKGLVSVGCFTFLAGMHRGSNYRTAASWHATSRHLPDIHDFKEVIQRSITDILFEAFEKENCKIEPQFSGLQFLHCFHDPLC